MSLELILVDDDLMVIKLHELMIRRSGVSVNPVSFTNGQEAVEYLDEQIYSNNTYLILLDINMPNMDGWEFLDIIQNKPYKEIVAVIMVTSSTHEADRKKALQYNLVFDYLEKPVYVDQFKQILEHPKYLKLINQHRNKSNT